ncbi:MAG: hypothetical protein IT546_14140 [Caulobacteraceae bacterium]|nr:hypothetical protein [Caulobacteraceae bacterium]
MSTPFAGGKVDFHAIDPGFEPLTTDKPRPDTAREEARSFAPARDADIDRIAEREFDREDRAFAAAAPSADEFTRDPPLGAEDAFAPPPAFVPPARNLRKRGGVNPAFVAIPVIAVVGVGAALLLTSNRGAETPDLGASLPVETAQAPLANPTLPPVAPPETAVVPPAPVEVAEAPPPAPAARVTPARRAAPRAERAAAPAAAAPAAADEMGVDASATLPAGPTTYSQLDRTGDPAPQAINPAGTVIAPSGVTAPPASTATAPVAPPAPAAAAPQPVVPPEPATVPDAPAVETPSTPQ